MANPDTSNKISRHGVHKDGYFTEYRAKNFTNVRMSEKKFRDNWRDKVLSILGKVCVKCGFSDIRALQIDHINGEGGKKYRRKWGSSYYKKIYEELIGGEKNKYQMLCANCNFIKRYTDNEVTGPPRKYE